MRVLSFSVNINGTEVGWGAETKGRDGRRNCGQDITYERKKKFFFKFKIKEPVLKNKTNIQKQNKRERKGKERKGKERKGKERKGKERKGKERKGKALTMAHNHHPLLANPYVCCFLCFSSIDM
jgi:hypothetical protein